MPTEIRIVIAPSQAGTGGAVVRCPAAGNRKGADGRILTFSGRVYSRACGMFRRAPLALVNRTPARARRHARTKHVNTWTVTCTHATCAAVEACTLGRYLVLPTVSHTCTLSMASCSAVMVAGLQGWCCVSVQRGISGYRRQHSGAWHVSHPLITPVVCTNT